MKVDLGVSVPFTVPNKKAGPLIRATPSEAGIARARHHRLPQIILAMSHTVTLAEGTKKAIRLSIPAYVRTELKRAFAKGTRTLKATLVVDFKTGGVESLVRTIPLTIHLVANPKRHKHRK